MVMRFLLMIQQPLKLWINMGKAQRRLLLMKYQIGRDFQKNKVTPWTEKAATFGKFRKLGNIWNDVANSLNMSIENVEVQGREKFMTDICLN